MPAHPSAPACRCGGMRSSSPGSQDRPRSAITIVLGRFDDLPGGGLRALIGGDPSLAIVAEDIEPRRIAVVLRAHLPDVAILDVAALAKPADVRELSLWYPGTRFVLLANDFSAVESAQLLAFGASACLGWDTESRDVLNAIHLASRGMQLVPRAPGAIGGSIAGGKLLTQREAEVLPLLQQGRSNPQIALALGVGVETIRTHARNIYRKLGVSSRRELAAPLPGELDDPPAPASSPRLRAGVGRARARRGHDVRHA
jgi:DNA-binding NarL/FixJ family response regulator